MDRQVFIYVDLDGTPLLVGRLWFHVRKGRENATFEYDDAWLQHRERFALEPALQLGPGPFHTGPGRALFGAIGDSAPDRWGRVLMRRAERRRARQAGEAPRTLWEIDYLLLVDDEARQGALRFADEQGGPFLAGHDAVRIPPLLELPRLLVAAEHVVDEDEDDEDLRLLLAPGSSLGGARPKASVRDRDGGLAFAKFPHKEDEWDTVTWEALALSLADKAGITLPDWRLEHIAGKPVLILRRFDRDGDIRIPFLSAMSMLGAHDNETRSYLEIVDALRQQGARAKADMHELWRRIVFTVLISNTDDHMRNHGFLYAGPDGWTLSPVYDLNPVPVDIKPRVLSTAIDFDDTNASLDIAMEVAEYFELGLDEARAIAGEVAHAVAGWRQKATALGLSKAACDRMSSAFDHDDLKAALAYDMTA
jgi:serine/threonine-protein kinase HipA